MIQICEDPSEATAVARKLDPQLHRAVVRQAYRSFLWRHVEKRHFHAARLAFKSLATR